MTPTAASPHRLYLARRDGQHRQLLNRAEVEDWHRAHGFAIVDFGELSFSEQLSLIDAARIIIGPDGSSFVNTFFARPGASISWLNGPRFDCWELYVQVTRALEQKLCALRGMRPAQRLPGQYFDDYTVDVKLLPELLAAMAQPDSDG